MKFWIDQSALFLLRVVILLFLVKVLYAFGLCSGRIACREGCSDMMSLPAKPRYFNVSFLFRIVLLCVDRNPWAKSRVLTWWILFRLFRVSMVSLPSWMRAAIWRRGQLSSVLTRYYNPLMRASSTSRKLGKKRSSSSLKRAKTVKSSSSQVHPLMLRILQVSLQSMYVVSRLVCYFVCKKSEEHIFDTFLSYPPFNRSVLSNMDMCCWSLAFWIACHRGLTAEASCLHFTWQQKLAIHTSDSVTTA